MKLDELRKQLRTAPDPKDATSDEFSAPKRVVKERCARCGDQHWVRPDGWLICDACRRDDTFARLWLNKAMTLEEAAELAKLGTTFCYACAAIREVTQNATSFCSSCMTRLASRADE